MNYLDTVLAAAHPNNINNEPSSALERCAISCHLQERLMFLDLSFTQVTGDVKVFVGNQQLQILKLASAPVFLGTALG